MIPSLIAGPLGFLVGSSYPAFHSFKAVKAKDNEQYHRWMKYWIVYSGFQTVAMVTDMFCSWVPFYQEMKLGLTFWLVLFEGSENIYHQLVAPFLDDYEPDIDKAVDQFADDMKKRASQIGAQGYETIQNAMLDTFDKAVTGERSSDGNGTEPTPPENKNTEADKITEDSSSTAYFGWPSIFSNAPTGASDRDAAHSNSRYPRQRPASRTNSALRSAKKSATGDKGVGSTAASWWDYTGLNAALTFTGMHSTPPKPTDTQTVPTTLESEVSHIGTNSADGVALTNTTSIKDNQGWFGGWGYGADQSIKQE